MNYLIPITILFIIILYKLYFICEGFFLDDNKNYENNMNNNKTINNFKNMPKSFNFYDIDYQSHIMHNISHLFIL